MPRAEVDFRLKIKPRWPIQSQRTKPNFRVEKYQKNKISQMPPKSCQPPEAGRDSAAAEAGARGGRRARKTLGVAQRRGKVQGASLINLEWYRNEFGKVDFSSFSVIFPFFDLCMEKSYCSAILGRHGCSKVRLKPGSVFFAVSRE